MPPALLLIACAAALALSSPVIGTPANLPVKPNILLIVGDDLGVQLGCYGDPQARTPEIDRLAAQGTRFQTAYVTQSSCSPSRSSLLTGLYPHQNGQIGLASSFAMHAGTVTLPAMLKGAGYQTGIIGKLHVQPEAAFHFDYARMDYREARDVARVADRAMGFWADARESPWFLMVNFLDPHVPFVTQDHGLPAHPHKAAEMKPLPFQQVDTPAQRERIAGYYNGVARLDAGVGLLLKRLQETGQADNTIVVFVGDNGPPFVRAKTNTTEAGLRVPLIVRWPHDAMPGTVNESLVSTTDLVPTFRSLAGLPPLPHLPGVPLVRASDSRSESLREYLFAEHHYHTAKMDFPQRVVRDARFKLVLNLKREREFGIGVDGDPAQRVLDDPAWAGTSAQRAFAHLRLPTPQELYDLEADPYELENLASRPEHAATLRRLQQALQAWREATHDPLLAASRLPGR